MKHNEKLINKVKETQLRKLFNLGYYVNNEDLDPKKLVLNYSKKILTDEEIEVLGHGLKYSLPPKKINYHRFFLSFEKLFNNLKDFQIFGESADTLHRVRTTLKNIAFTTYYTFNSRQRPNFEHFHSILKKLSEDKTIIITKPDKGNGIVILDKNDYLIKMKNIINDGSKFRRIEEDWFKVIIRREDKINRFLAKLLKEKSIDKATYDHLRVSGSQPGILYGLPKVHKTGVPMRPILSAIGTSGYDIAKFLLPFLTPLTSNQFTISDSFSFVKDIINFPLNNDCTMASFDIKSLFTNIPLDETIKITGDLLYDSNNYNIPPMSK